MNCEKHWELRYGWHYTDSNYVYNEYKTFCKEIDINKFIFELFHNENIKIDWYKKIYIEDWKNF